MPSADCSSPVVVSEGAWPLAEMVAECLLHCGHWVVRAATPSEAWITAYYWGARAVVVGPEARRDADWRRVLMQINITCPGVRIVLVPDCEPDQVVDVLDRAIAEIEEPSAA